MNRNAQKTLAARAAIVGTALAAFSVLPCTASASTIYQDNFSGSKTAALNGAVPTIDNGPSGTTWTASGAWADSGYSSATTGRQNAYLSFAPTSGQVYTLTAGLDVTGAAPGQADANNWAALGFMTTQSTTGGWDTSGASPWVLSAYNASWGGAFAGPAMNAMQGFTPTSGNNTYSIVLNTGSAAYSYQVFLTNSAVTNGKVGSGTFSTNPVIQAVGLENGLGNVQVTDFSLTSAPVPEPATLGLMALGGLGLLLLKLRKAV